MTAGIAVGERPPGRTPRRKRKSTFWDRFRQRAPEPPPDVIPPMAQMYGIGPNYVNDYERAPVPEAGNPYAPRIGQQQPTHQQVIESQRFGNPQPVIRDVEDSEYWQRRDGDDETRHSEEAVQPVGWNTPTHSPELPSPAGITRNVAPPSPRPQLAQHHGELYSMTNTGVARRPDRLTGDHFSMADHRRDYPILGMEPVHTRRNTYRLEPGPWDVDIIDEPVETEPVNATMMVAPTPFDEIYGNRSYRLG